VEDYVKTILRNQFEASLAMLGQCIERCPAEHWNGRIVKYEFWHVAYHTLYCTDAYLAPNWDQFEPCEFLPAGVDEIMNEYPSREMSQAELTGYVALIHQRAVDRFAAETEASLQQPIEFDWLPPMSRGELHISSIRHITHHTGQLGAFLRRYGVDTEWVPSG
jgi:hypothetical protein